MTANLNTSVNSEKHISAVRHNDKAWNLFPQAFFFFFFLEEIKPTPHDACAREELKLIREAFQFLLYTVSTEVTTQNVVIFGHDSKHSDQSAACYSGRPVWNKSSNIFEMIKRKKKGKKRKKSGPVKFCPDHFAGTERSWGSSALTTHYINTHTPVKTRITRTSGSLTSLQHKSENTMLTNKTKKRKWKDTIQWTITTPPTHTFLHF